MDPLKILIIATSHDQLGDTQRKTGIWLEELAVPYYIFKDAGTQITLASPLGGAIPLDPKSESIMVANSVTKRFRKDVDAVAWMENSVPFNTLKAVDFDFVFLPGGHGPMWDLAANESLKQLLEDFNRQFKLLGAVCHGVVGLISLESSLGGSLVEGRRLTAFSNSEERISGLTDVVPFLLETALTNQGAIYSKGPDFESYIVVDGNIITGQNPASSAGVAKKLLICQKELKPLYALN